MLDQSNQTSLLDIRGVCRSFPKGSGEDLLVLEKVDLTIHSGEIVGLLGRSGSGKSTLLRIIAGLIAPSSGDAKCRGETIIGPPNGVSMVFQSFALFPWLTVLQNVELGWKPWESTVPCAAPGRSRRSTSSGSTGSSRHTRRNYRAGCGSASGLRGRWLCIRIFC
jgi:ABC-type Fe3+/spermidine/putrescine transport system ATPase subunit